MKGKSSHLKAIDKVKRSTIKQIEDLGLLLLMKQANRSQKVSRAEVMHKLKSNNSKSTGIIKV